KLREAHEKGARQLARRSRGTPRLANRLLRRVRDFAQVRFDGKVTEAVATVALDLLDVDQFGLETLDRKILETMLVKFDGGPVGLETLAASIGEDPGTLEDVYEPYLLLNGFINRTPRGRIATQRAAEHLGLPYPGEE
ncbi:MAG: Holliday junction DNA helicase RuvB C-terminal domain-containing protein, partial [bacterium]